MTVLEANYERLKGDAKVCFSRLRNAPDQAADGICNQFRQDCRELLTSIYSLLARISLDTHLSDRERIAQMGEIGFSLKPSATGPLPDADDLAALGVLLGLAVLAPIALINGEIGKPLVIYGMVITTVLTPIVVAHIWPRFAMSESRYGPGIAFPLVTGLAAAAFQIAISFAFLGKVEWGSSRMDALEAHLDRIWPWTAYVFSIGILIAICMRIGRREQSANTNRSGWRAWGCLYEAALFACVGGLIICFAFLSDALDPSAGVPPVRAWGRIVIPTVAAFVVGFFVPTWYRAKLREKHQTEVRPIDSTAVRAPKRSSRRRSATAGNP